MAGAESWPSIVNLTPHDVHVQVSDSEKRTFPRSGVSLRTVNAREPRPGFVPHGASQIPTVTVENQKFDQEGLDILERCRDRAIIVSGTAAEAILRLMMLGKYPDIRVLVPDTSPASVIRDAGGNILGVKRFLAYPTHAELLARLQRDED